MSTRTFVQLDNFQIVCDICYDNGLRCTKGDVSMFLDLATNEIIVQCDQCGHEEKIQYIENQENENTEQDIEKEH